MNNIELLPNDIIIGFDPGESTGVVRATYLGNKVFRTDAAHVIMFDDLRFKRLDEEMLLRPKYVLYETFRLYKKSAKSLVNDEFIAVQMIGNIQSAADKWHIKPSQIIKQGAWAQKQKDMEMEILKGHEIVKKSSHTISAYKHIRYFLLSNGYSSKRNQELYHSGQV